MNVFATDEQVAFPS